eukprot:m.32836 g.32836  ORF g.32836 m.32836 type:complete len:79 (+) comp8456_c0_seq1:765-1001(+)
MITLLIGTAPFNASMMLARSNIDNVDELQEAHEYLGGGSGLMDEIINIASQFDTPTCRLSPRGRCPISQVSGRSQGGS